MIKSIKKLGILIIWDNLYIKIYLGDFIIVDIFRKKSIEILDIFIKIINKKFKVKNIKIKILIII